MRDELKAGMQSQIDQLKQQLNDSIAQPQQAQQQAAAASVAAAQAVGVPNSHLKAAKFRLNSVGFTIPLEVQEKGAPTAGIGRGFALGRIVAETTRLLHLE
jgi:hypothetical protein